MPLSYAVKVARSALERRVLNTRAWLVLYAPIPPEVDHNTLVCNLSQAGMVVAFVPAATSVPFL